MRDKDSAKRNPLSTFYDSNNKRRPLRQTLRNAVLIRDEFTCQYCGDTATDVDHVIPYSFGGKDSEKNLVAACRWCNSQLSNRFFDDGIDGKRLFIAERLHLKARRFRRKVSICADCKEVYAPASRGATAILCADCARADDMGLNGSILPESPSERKRSVREINQRIKQSEGKRIAEDQVPYEF